MQLKIAALLLLLVSCGSEAQLMPPTQTIDDFATSRTVTLEQVPRDYPVNAMGGAFAPSIDHVAANDVQQGYNGNCWFNAVIAALALRQPEAITDAIADTQDANTWTVRIFDLSSREPHYYTVKAPFTDRLANKQVAVYRWPLILENAVVQYNNETGHLHYGVKGYPGINGGRCEWAFQMFLKGPSWGSPFPKTNRAFARRIRTGDPLVTPHWHSTNKRLVPEHAYTLVEVSDDNSKVTVRNPWAIGGDDGHGYLTLPNRDVRAHFWGLVFSVAP